MITIELIDELRRRANVSYENAKEALEKSNGDLVEALIYLESHDKIKSEGTSEKDSFFDKIRGLVKKSNNIRFIVSKNERTALNLSLTVTIVIGVVAFHVSIIALIIALLTGYRFRLEKNNGEDMKVKSGWNAQEHMSRNFHLVSDYLEEGTSSSKGKIKRLAELDALSITIFNQKGNVLYTTEELNTPIDFYGNGDLVGAWNINANYIIAKDNIVTGNDPASYSLGYAMILREEIQWNDMPAQIQIKNRMLKENTSLIIILLALLVMGILQLLNVVISGSNSSKKILKPIEVMTQTVENITINQLNTRLDISGS